MILGQSLFQIFKSSIVMLILLGCSVAVLALIIERLWYFARNRFNVSKGLRHIRMIYKDTGLGPAIGYARSIKNPLGRLFTMILENDKLSLDELDDLSYGLIIDERIRSERFLGGLGTLANVATLLGLLGTVTGLIRAFHSIAITGSGGPVVVSAGIAEALLTTAFGLCIGIPALLFYNYFAKKAGDIAMTLESAQEKFLIFLEIGKQTTKEIKTREPRAARKAEAQVKEKAKEEVWRY
ncbi:MAG: MotA/TolQ/ExbB proton channel family protein [candidate division WOR-3 bacterium]|nr:MotA/TolQ/ExbB proton channel family protein [candidate division WOR-3 bacterium]MDH5683164.1 MotA/TolQ/ExbB proton channel family protein [candidate division WOR-3 bacterium]